MCVTAIQGGRTPLRFSPSPRASWEEVETMRPTVSGSSPRNQHGLHTGARPPAAQQKGDREPPRGQTVFASLLGALSCSATCPHGPGRAVSEAALGDPTASRCRDRVGPQGRAHREDIENGHPRSWHPQGLDHRGTAQAWPSHHRHTFSFL